MFGYSQCIFRPLAMRIAGAQVAQMSQEVRDAVGTLLLQLTLKELFQWRFMQTDPNWGNFLFDGNSGILHLIDFGKLDCPLFSA